MEELQQQQALPEDSLASVPSPGPGKNEDDLKTYALETPVSLVSICFIHCIYQVRFTSVLDYFSFFLLV